MRKKIIIAWAVMGLTTGAAAQQPSGAGSGLPDNKTIRIVDTLTPQEKTNRNTVILRSELDSMISYYNLSNPVMLQSKEPVKETIANNELYILAAVLLILFLLGLLMYSFYTWRKKFNSAVAVLKRQLNHQPNTLLKMETGNHSREKNTKGRSSISILENRITDLNDELHKLTKENEGLNRVLKEYNGIQHEYDSLKHGMSKAYKVKNYPGYDKEKAEDSLMKAVLDTENAVAAYAYEKFLKPVLVITDANKNNPAKISEADQHKLVDLLVSLSLLYIEYLYLRVNELSIGGKMVERIQGFSNGNGLNPALLKKLNTDHGSRALALRIALDKSGIQKLSYPVFDETDLNNP